jgi:hypothetical protein
MKKQKDSNDLTKLNKNFLYLFTLFMAAFSKNFSMIQWAESKENMKLDSLSLKTLHIKLIEIESLWAQTKNQIEELTDSLNSLSFNQLNEIQAQKKLKQKVKDMVDLEKLLEVIKLKIMKISLNRLKMTIHNREEILHNSFSQVKSDRILQQETVNARLEAKRQQMNRKKHITERQTRIEQYKSKKYNTPEEDK